jgi:DNA mismatch repair protein MutL
MVTSANGESGGTYLSLDNGKIIQHETQARSQGTTITVNNLFRRIPARLKFLKSETAEAGRVADIVSQYALAYPEVRFTLINEGKTSLRTPGSGKLIDSVIAVYGIEVAQNMLEIVSQEESQVSSKPAIRVTGLAGSPRVTRATREYIHVFVNHRWINNRMISYVLSNYLA